MIGDGMNGLYGKVAINRGENTIPLAKNMRDKISEQNRLKAAQNR